jgi:hypothetical protein
MFSGKLIRSGNNAKTVKGDGEYETAIMYLAPHTLAGGKTVCPFADVAKCAAACLYTAGRGAYNNVQQARINKAAWFHRDREGFMKALRLDLAKFALYCIRKGVRPAVRLNGTSDILWERIPVGNARNIMEAFPDIQFYDYTKVVDRVTDTLPANYSLVMSYSGASDAYRARLSVNAALNPTANVAVVFRDKETRARYMATGFLGRPVIDGDRDDLRFNDPKGVVVGLYAKGKAKTDTTGFVVD